MSKLLESLNNVKKQMNQASYSEAMNLLNEAIKVYEKQLSANKDVIDIQCSDGNWNYDPYMHGMANGMLMVESIFTDEPPEFLDAPKVWLESIDIDEKPVASSDLING